MNIIDFLTGRNRLIRYEGSKNRFLRILISIYLIGVVFTAVFYFYNNLKYSRRRQDMAFRDSLMLLEERLISSKKLYYKYDSTRILRVNTKYDSVKTSVTDTLNAVKGRLAKLEKFNLGLRQAINPLKPDEVLTIARLEDQVKILTEQNKSLSDKTKEQQGRFEDSIKRELDGSSKNLYFILATLVPLVLNYLYTLWKDNIKPKSVIEVKDETDDA